MSSDRPFRRRAIKLLARVLLGGRRAHYHSWWPSLRIEGREAGRPGEVRFRGKDSLPLLGTDALAERAGERIVIVGSGPSVSGADLKGLPDRSTILLNGAISLIGQGIDRPLAIAIEDERFVWRHFGMMRERMTAPDTFCLMSPGVIRAIGELDARFLEGRPLILIDDVSKPYGAPRRSAADIAGFEFVTVAGDDGFSSDPDRGVFQGGSVAISALQFALATHAREIGFIGVDIANADGPRFYEVGGDIAFSGIAGAEKRILGHIALAARIAAGNGVRLINHSPVSALRSIGLDYRPLNQTAS